MKLHTENQVSELDIFTPQNFDFALIQVIDGKVNARNLYVFLQLAAGQFSRWAKLNILDNPFAEGEFVGFDIMSKGNKSTNYHLTIEFAKKLAMQAKSEAGEKARNYFLECEKKALKPMLPQTYAEALRTLASEVETREKIEKELNYKNQIVIERAESVPAKTMRATINEICRSNTKNGMFADKWNKLYSEAYYLGYGDIKTKAKNSGKKSVSKSGKITYKKNGLDIAEETGQLENLYNLALKMFEADKIK